MHVIKGEICHMKLYDVSEAITLERLMGEMFGGRVPVRQAFLRIRVESITLVTPPIVLNLGERSWLLNGISYPVRVEAHFYEMGVVSIVVFSPLNDLSLDEWVHLAIELYHEPQIEKYLDQELSSLLTFVSSAIVKQHPVADFYEKFTCYQLLEVDMLVNRDILLEFPQLVSMLHGEKRLLSRQQTELIYENASSFYENDIAVLNYNNALVIGGRDTGDLLVLIEYAVAQVLEARYYDITLNMKLASLYEQMDVEVGMFKILFSRRGAKVLRKAMKLSLEARLAIDGLISSVRVTEDVYYAQIYNRALEIFRTSQWLDDIENKLQAMKEACEMMNDEIESRRSNFLEWLVATLVVFEFLPMLFRLYDIAKSLLFK